MLDAFNHAAVVTVRMYLVLLAAYAWTAWLFDCTDIDRPDKIQRGKVLSAKMLRRDRLQSITAISIAITRPISRSGAA